MPELLKMALTMTVEPGTNLKGEVAGANWTFLLPSRELDRTVCIGPPSASSMATLSHLGSEVTIACSSQAQMQKANETWLPKQYGNVRLILNEDRSKLPLLDDSVDLLFITEKGAWWQLNNTPLFQEELVKALTLSLIHL